VRRAVSITGAGVLSPAAEAAGAGVAASPPTRRRLRFGVALDDAAAAFLPPRFAFADLSFSWRKMPISLSDAGNGILPHESLTAD